MSLMMYNGHLLLVDGHLTEDADCCCADIADCCFLGDPLTGTITDKTGDCTTLADTCTFTLASGSSWEWTSNTLANPCPPAASFGFTLRCNEGSGPNWELFFGGGGGSVSLTYTVIQATCADPASLVIDCTLTNISTGCTGTFRITIGP
jgi:hypothetical protein